MKPTKQLSFAALLTTTVLISGGSSFAEPVFKGLAGEYQLECGRPGGKMVRVVTSDPKSFNPIVSDETSTGTFTGSIFEGLTRTHPLTLEVLPNLAQSWETQDGREWIFHLRQDVRWNDGERFTARDVVFTFNQLIYNPDIPNSARSIFTIEGKEIEVEALSDYRVRFRLPFTFAPFLRTLGQGILPYHKYAKLVQEGKFNFSLGLDTRLEDIVGTGPYCLKKYIPGVRVILAPNPYYWKQDACGNKLPYLEEILFVILPSQDTALLKFLEGESDYYGLRPQDLSILGPRRLTGNFIIYNAGPATGSNFLVFNQNNQRSPQTSQPFVAPHKLAWFSDIRFRQAASFAIDRERIVEVVLYGLGQPQYSAVSPANTFFYSEDVKRYPYQPQKSRRLLRQMGFRDRDADGILEDSHNNKLELNFFTNADNSERVQIATLVKKDLEDVGLAVNFLPLDFNNLVSKLIATHDWEAILIGLTGGIEPYFGKNVWSYTGKLHMWNTTKTPLAAFEQEIEDIFDAAAKTLDEEERRRLFSRWQRIVSQELPLIYTVLPYSLYAVRNRFGNVYPTVYHGAFPEIEHIFIKNK